MPPNSAAIAPTTWQGVALGADAELRLYHPDPRAARRLIDQALAELHRLEGIFSLYRDDSALARLNRQGYLADPPADLLRLLGDSLRYSRLTDGAFDPTVQPLWQLYASHFARPGASAQGPSEAAQIGGVHAGEGRGEQGEGGFGVEPARFRFGAGPRVLPVVRLRRLRLGNNAPVGIQTVHLRLDRVPGLLDGQPIVGSLYAHLRQHYGIAPLEATEVYRVASVAPDEAALLDVPAGSPAFVVERTTVDARGPFEFTVSTMRGDRYEIRSTLRS